MFQRYEGHETSQKNKLHEKSVDVVIKGKMWLKNLNQTAATIEIPDGLMKLAKKVKSNAAIECEP